MKRLYIAAFLLLIAVAAANGQPNRHERIKAEKIAFITDELNLTPEEAQIFWPVYNQMCSLRNEYHCKSNEIMREMKVALENGAPETELKRLINEYAACRKKCDNVLNNMIPELSKVLSTEKLAKLLVSEEQFMIRQMKQLRQGKDR